MPRRFGPVAHVAPRVKALLLLAMGAQILSAASLQANNVVISNVTTTGQDNINDFVLIQFDVSWENSWRVESVEPNSWDAVWIFVKYRLDQGDPWKHATLNISGHTEPSGSSIDTPADGKGVFLYRSTAGDGTFNLTGVQLRWNYGVGGLADNVQNVDVKVLAVEMVYIPKGAFAVGSGGTEFGAFTLTTIDTADARVAPSGIGSHEGQAGGHPTGTTPPDSSAWPNGYSAFYVQKYETSQGQYAEFLSLLTLEQQGNRFFNISSSRYTITSTPPGFTAGAPDRAGNFLSWSDGTAYADWAALRPMTEMEFEKAARGTAFRVPNEFAWGSDTIYAVAYVVTGDGTPSATVNSGSATGNASYSTTDAAINGPLRVGIFAASIGSPTRDEAGSSFFGVMELSGNVWERAVSLTNATGRAFLPDHGDGALTVAGTSNVPAWPPGGLGTGWRGGSWVDSSDRLRVSDRSSAANNVNSRQQSTGFRSVRTAP